MHKCHFGATEIDFLGRTITPEGVKPQKKTNYQLLGKNEITEVLVFQLLKRDEKVLVTTELVEQFNDINKDWIGLTN